MAFKLNRSSKEPMSEINVTPFVDVMLVLLIIFMVTAPLLTVGVQVDLPESSADSLPEEQEPLTLTINSKGEIFIQESKVEYEKIISNIQEIKSRKGKIIVITDSKNDKVLKELANDLVVVPKTNHYAFVIFASIVLQLLAYHIALCKKLNVDQPRNLAKSVSVE